jgi:hypothetical protein
MEKVLVKNDVLGLCGYVTESNDGASLVDVIGDREVLRIITQNFSTLSQYLKDWGYTLVND